MLSGTTTFIAVFFCSTFSRSFASESRVILVVEHLLYKDAKRTRAVQPGEEKALGRHDNSLSISKGLL